SSRPARGEPAAGRAEAHPVDAGGGLTSPGPECGRRAGRIRPGMPGTTEMLGRTRRRLRGRGLLLDALERRVEASPAGRLRAPDVRGRLDRRGIVQRSDANDRETRVPGGLGEQVASALRAEAATDTVAALGRAHVLAGGSGDF